MPITFTVAQHPARKWTSNKVATTEELLKGACPQEFRRSKRVIQSSFSQQLRENHISASEHGFVLSVYRAYCHHHHLTLRPEDVWFSILSQLTFFITAHAEELRSFFVAHQGKKELEVVAQGNLDTANFGALAMEMTELIEQNVVDPELRTWIMPEFSTTTDSDRVVAAILMMGAMQEYFSYTMSLICGIPSVTLLGEKEDWVQMVGKLDKITQLGDEPTTFARLLKPVLQHFVKSFDDPTSSEVVDFWGKCAHHQSGGSGPTYISGWITAFCFWDSQGRLLYKNPKSPAGPGEVVEDCVTGCELDGIQYHRIESTDVPYGFASVPVKINDNGKIYKTKMMAGMVGIQATSTGQMLDGTHDHNDGRMVIASGFGSGLADLVPKAAITTNQSEEPGLDSIQPVSGWWMYETEDPEAAQAREAEIKTIEEELDTLDFNDSANSARITQLISRSTDLREF